MISRRARTASLVLALSVPTWLGVHTAQAPAKASGKGTAETNAVERLLTGRRGPLVPSSLIDWSKVEIPSPRAGDRRRKLGRFPIRGTYNFGTAVNRFGDNRGDHIHAGQDILSPAGTPLVAVLDAVVIEEGSDGGRGNYVAIYSRATRRTYVYFHMLAPAIVPVGDRVRAGQRLGSVGCTGSCFGDHLHFEVRVGRGTAAKPIDPLPELERWRK